MEARDPYYPYDFPELKRNLHDTVSSGTLCALFQQNSRCVMMFCYYCSLAAPRRDRFLVGGSIRFGGTIALRDEDLLVSIFGRYDRLLRGVLLA